MTVSRTGPGPEGRPTASSAVPVGRSDSAGSGAGSGAAQQEVAQKEGGQPELEQDGLHKGLGQRQLQMIAIGSAIGTGLFLGTGSRLQTAGPFLAVLYLVCGFFGYLILRCLGELIVHRPSYGSFVSYCREFYGEPAAYVSGWLYWFNWAMTAVADATAIAIYLRWFSQYVAWIGAIPQWLTAMVVLALVLSINLISVKWFGEFEFWFSAIKVGALLLFLVVGIWFVVFGSPNGQPTGFNLITGNGGILPKGIIPALVVTQGVVFAYSGIELVGTTSGETKDARTVIPKAINLVMLRILIFYFGSVLLLCMLLPYTSYSGGESPFVTFFSSIGVDIAAPITQLVVITAAFSSLNAGLYSTGRIMYSLARAGSAPKFAGKLTKSGVPFGGIVMTGCVGVIGVFINMFVPKEAFEIVINLASIGVMGGWAAITISHLKFTKLAKQGKYERPEYAAPFAPFINYAILTFLATVVVLMAFDYPIGTSTLGVSLLFIPGLWIGWRAVRGRVNRIAAEREAREARLAERRQRV